MAVKISGIEKNSLLKKYNLNPSNTELISVNSNEINDILDYQYYISETNLEIVLKNNSELLNITIEKDEYEDLGLLFNTYLIDKEWHCKNKCIFCFIDQMPSNMRETLYFKDDDARLSFLFGNYITLTNLSENDISRIIKMKTSPINVSVHATVPQVRSEMMGNPTAGNCMDVLKRLTAANIKINAQLVICPGINDGEILLQSMRDLSNLMPSLQSVSVVPVGLTKYREGLFKLLPVTKHTACDIIDLVQKYSDETLLKHGSRIFYLADEFFVKAERTIPPESYYEDFLQLENGVGVRALFLGQFLNAISEIKNSFSTKDIGIITGEASYEFISELTNLAKKRFPSLIAEVYKINNDFFGETIDVAGLITGRDIINQLNGKFKHEICLIPEVMLNYGKDKFLDNITIKEVGGALNTDVLAVPIDGEMFLSALCGV